MNGAHVRPNRAAAKAQVSAALAAGWGRVIHLRGKGALADGIGVSERGINRALIGETVPELHNAINSLTVDATALDEVLALVGFSLTPIDARGVDDMQLVTGLSGAVADYLARMGDGRCHVDTAALAKLFRPLIGQMQAIVDADDAQRGLRAV